MQPTSKFRQHFFVCTNARPPFAKPSCGPLGSNPIAMKLKEEVENRGLEDEVKVTASGCLGPCESGPVIVVYPEATWYKNVTLEDVDEIIESHMVGGKPVARLVYEWSDAD